MSSSFRNLLGRGYTWVCASGALLCTMPAGAQQLTFQPNVQTTAEYDTNPLLQPSTHPQSGEWFQGLFSGLLDRATAVSDLQLRPQVTVQDSTVKALDTWEALVNLHYRYLTRLNIFDLISEFHRQDTYNAEYGVAEYNFLNPNAPATNGSGYIITGVTRDSFQVSPSLTHTFTERFTGEIEAQYVGVRYSTQVPQELVSFNAPSASINALWAMSARSQVGFGPFYSQFTPLDPVQEGVVKSDSYGGDLFYKYATTDVTTMRVDLKVGRDEQDQFLGPRLGTTTWGLEWLGTYKWQTSKIQFTVGRSMEPSSIGGELAVDMIRFQFTHDFSQTLSGDIAFRGSHQKGVGIEEDELGTRLRGYGDASLKQLITREFFVTGGYRFLLQRLPGQKTAQDHSVFLTIGWHPLEPR